VRKPGEPAPVYFILLEWTGDAVTNIRDFRHASYAAQGAEFITAS